uniref:Uncharacterized protein n=1 Tax=Cajanus cajan TaxID=3821 RepID=A0A151TC83_CAJCA|nr:hypothetical protein KK1_019264 [Cajanus cajan]
MTSYHTCNFHVHKVETSSLLTTIIWIISMCVHNVYFELNYKYVFYDIHSNSCINRV